MYVSCDWTARETRIDTSCCEELFGWVIFRFSHNLSDDLHCLMAIWLQTAATLNNMFLNFTFLILSSMTLVVAIPIIDQIDVCMHAYCLVRCDYLIAHGLQPHSNKFIGIAMKIKYLLNMSKCTHLKYGQINPIN